MRDTILIVEDDEMICQGIVDALQLRNWKTDVAATCEEAEKKIKEYTYMSVSYTHLSVKQIRHRKKMRRRAGSRTVRRSSNSVTKSRKNSRRSMMILRSWKRRPSSWMKRWRAMQLIL